MQAILTVRPLRYLSPWELAGPLFDKELRVASRQRRSYLLRFAYAALLTCFAAGVWHFFVVWDSPRSVAYQVSRLGAAGTYIAVTIVWFQFVTSQLLAVILLSGAIGEETRKRTLHVLVVTPMSGMQIVGGKLAGGLLRVVMLLAISLPLLALVRVFGGISWEYIVSGVCVTFAALVFTGALSLLASVFYGTVLAALILGAWFCVLYLLFDLLIAWLARFSPVVREIGAPVLLLVNPTDVLIAQTRAALAARPGIGLSSWWPVHCLILLAGAVVVLLLAARRVRRVAALPVADPARKDRKRIGTAGSPNNRMPDAPAITRVKGSPIVWKELRKFAGLRSRPPLARLARSTAGAFFWVALMSGIVLLAAGFRWSALLPMLGGCALGFQGGLLGGLGATAAAAISREREARTLPVLLTTPLDDGVIVKDKAVAAFRQCFPTVAPFLVLYFSLLVLLLGLTNRADVPALLYGAGLCLVGLLGIVPFVVGLGLYCSTRLKTTAGSIACTSILFWGLMLGGLIAFVSMPPRRIIGGARIWLTASAFVLIAALIFAGAGLALLRAAARRLRGNVF